MNTDRYFEIGSSHSICQDYAFSGQFNKMAYAIVSDGCSKSHEVCGELDVGARIVALAGRKALFTLFGSPDCNLMPESGKLIECSDMVSSLVIETLKDMTADLFLHEQRLDCTLLMALCDGETTYVFVYGDGGFVVDFGDSSMYKEVWYANSMPYYLSYGMSKARKSQYPKGEEDKAIITTYDMSPIAGSVDKKAFQSEGIDTVNTINADIYRRTSFFFTGVKTVSVFSDGVRSFDPKNPEFTAHTNVAKEITSFKNYNGKFVSRRLNAFKRDCDKLVVAHDDDLSIASITM